jgi:hypothetical protein
VARRRLERPVSVCLYHCDVVSPACTASLSLALPDIGQAGHPDTVRHRLAPAVHRDVWSTGALDLTMPVPLRIRTCQQHSHRTTWAHRLSKAQMRCKQASQRYRHPNGSVGRRRRQRQSSADGATGRHRQGGVEQGESAASAVTARRVSPGDGRGGGGGETGSHRVRSRRMAARRHAPAPPGAGWGKAHGARLLRAPQAAVACLESQWLTLPGVSKVGLPTRRAGSLEYPEVQTLYVSTPPTGLVTGHG